MLMAALFPGPRLSHYAICLQNCSDDVLFRHNFLLLPGLVESFSVPVFILLFFFFLKTQTVYLCGHWSVRHRSLHAGSPHTYTQQERGLQLWGVLQVGFTPVLSLTALLLFKFGRAIRSKH